MNASPTRRPQHGISLCGETALKTVLQDSRSSQMTTGNAVQPIHRSCDAMRQVKAVVVVRIFKVSVVNLVTIPISLKSSSGI